MRYVSYSFFRHEASAYESERAGAARGRFFVNYLRSLPRAHWSVYSDLKLVIHHDERVKEYPYFKAIQAMEREGLLELVPMGEAKTLTGSMLWRMKAIFRKDAEIVLCRDLDSLSTPRERIAVERWINSGKAIHVIHDSVSHSGIMGGTLGIRCSKFKDLFPTWEHMQGSIENTSVDWNKLGSDQRWLAWNVEPAFSSSEILVNTKEMMGPKEDPRDLLCNGVGLAFHVEPVVKYYDEHEPNEKILKCERGLS